MFNGNLPNELNAVIADLNATLHEVNHLNQPNGLLNHGLLGGAAFGGPVFAAAPLGVGPIGGAFGAAFGGGLFGAGLGGLIANNQQNGPQEGAIVGGPQNEEGGVDLNLPLLGLGRGQFQAEASGDNLFLFLTSRRGRGMAPDDNYAQARGRLHSPDWARQQMTPIRKNVYEEHCKTALRSPAEVDAFREINGIRATGRDVPKPLLDIGEAGMDKDLMKGVQAMMHSPLTGLHSQCWPIALSGRDLLVVFHAETEGKTVGYILPAIVHVQHQEHFGCSSGPIVLILAATRESAEAIEQDFRDLARHTSLKVMCLSSGLRKEPQLKQLEDGAEVCIATPGRLVSFIEDSKVELQHCTYLILDGADRMVAMGHKKQLRTIANHIRPDRQTLIWVTNRSVDTDHVTNELLRDYVTVTVGSSKACRNPRVEHVVLVCEEEAKEDALIALFQDILCEESDKVIVFAEMRQTVDDLVVKMHDQGWPAVGIHRKKEAKERDWALEAFRLRNVPILIATDIITCSIDSDDVRFVINYDRPATREDYSRRIRHAARSDGSGKGYTFLAPSDSGHAEEMVSIFDEAKQEIPREVLRIAKKKQPYRDGCVRLQAASDSSFY